MRLEEILQEKWSDSYKKSINCSNPKGFSQKAHCAGKKKNENIVTPITKKDAALSKQAKHLKMKSMFAPGPVNQTVGANDAFLKNMSQTGKDANTLSKAAGIDTNFTKNAVANALKNTQSNTRLTSKFGRNKNEAYDDVGQKIYKGNTTRIVNTPVADKNISIADKRIAKFSQQRDMDDMTYKGAKITVPGTNQTIAKAKSNINLAYNKQDKIDQRQGAGQSYITKGKPIKFESLDNVIKKAEIYVDMDGVLADFFGVWTKMVGVKQWKDIKNVDGALDMIRNKEDFWINLPLAPNASKLLNSIKKVKGNYNILSSPLPNDPNSEPQKREWVQKMLSGFAPKRVIITHNKSAYAKQPDGTPNILIDDYGDNINKWESAGGVGIQHSDKNVDNTVKRLEEDAFTDFGRLINRSIRPGFYKRAAEKFHEWLKDQTTPYRHSLGYYAMEWANKYKNMDWRNLRKAYIEMFGDDVLVESVNPIISKIKDMAVKHGIDPNILLAIAWKESKIVPGLVGDTDKKHHAYGVFQVRYPALKDVNTFYKKKFTVDDMKNDIDKNIEVGALYLKMMKDRYKATDIYSQIAGYNGGPKATKGKIDQANVYADRVLDNYRNEVWKQEDDGSEPQSSRNVLTPPSPELRPDDLIPTPPPSPELRPDDLPTIPTPPPSPRMRPSIPTPPPSPRMRPDDLIPTPSPRRRPDDLIPTPTPSPRRRPDVLPTEPKRITYVDLAKSNGIKDPNKINIGQPITLPNGNNYIVKKGDTLSRIAQAFNIMQPMTEGKEPKLVKDKKLKNLRTMNKPTKYERRKNYAQAEEGVKEKEKKEDEN